MASSEIQLMLFNLLVNVSLPTFVHHLLSTSNEIRLIIFEIQEISLRRLTSINFNHQYELYLIFAYFPISNCTFKIK